MSELDQSFYVPVSYPDLVALRSYGCPTVKRRQPRYDFTREFFCQKWGDSFKCICPPPNPKGVEPIRPRFRFQGVGSEVKSFDYFSALPLRPEGRYLGMKPKLSMAEKKGLEYPEKVSQRELPFSSLCPDGTAFKADLFSGDSVCGACVPTDPSSGKVPIVCDDFPGYDISPNLPFRVCIGEVPSGPPKIRIRSGAERCLQPSRYRDISSVYKLNFHDFFKTKTPKELSLYRSPLAIDKRRPRPTIPVKSNGGIAIGVNSGPLYVNAQHVQWKSYGKRSPPCLNKGPDFQVIVPGPITIPTDYCY